MLKCSSIGVRMSSLPLRAGDPVTWIDNEVRDSSTSSVTKSVNGVVVSTGLGSSVNYRHIEREYARGRKLPNFHQRKNSGELLPQTHYLNISHKVVFSGPPTLTYTGVWLPTGDRTTYVRSWNDGSALPMFKGMNGTDSIITLPLSWVLSEIESRGIDPRIFVSAAAAKVYSEGWDALTFIAEFGKVVAMFKSAIPRFIRLITDYRREVSLAAASKAAYRSFDEWLKGRYGWRILVYDIIDINKAIVKLGEDDRTRSSHRTGTTIKVETGSSGLYEDNTLRIEHLQTITADISIRGSVVADFEPSIITLNPILTAWELIPYSFVLDWFVQIGQWIETMSFLAVADKYTASYGIYASINQTETVEQTLKSNPGGFQYDYATFDQMGYVNTATVKLRQPIAVSYLPSQSVKLNAFKVVDLIALIFQALGRR